MSVRLVWKVESSVDHEHFEMPFGTDTEGMLRYAAARDAHPATDYVRIRVMEEGRAGEWREATALEVARSFGERRVLS